MPLSLVIPLFCIPQRGRSTYFSRRFRLNNSLPRADCSAVLPYKYPPVSIHSSHRQILCCTFRPFLGPQQFCREPPSTMSVRREEDPRIQGISSSIRVVPDFPKPGIMFQDITTLLLDPRAFRDTIDLFVEKYKNEGISVVAGIEARGFIFGPPIALEIGAKFVPLRKPRKLPGDVISEEYVLEYGRDCLEMHVGAIQPGERALVVDDLIATGGTLCAAIKLLERVGAEVVECACVIELPDLKGRERLSGKKLFILIESR